MNNSPDMVIIKALLLLAILPLFSECNKSKAPDPANLPSAFISDAIKSEGNSNSTLDFKVYLDKTYEKPVKMDYTTKDGTAKAGEDYTTTKGILTIDPGSTQGTITVPIVGDTLYELDETFEILISNPLNCVILTNSGPGTILNDDKYTPSGVNDGYITPLTYSGMKLVWSDEFNGTQIDTSNWTHETGAHGWGNNELQNYTTSPENSFISNGVLVIEAKQSGSGYSSARMITMGKREFKYGRIDIRAKLPKGKGIWPALWMLGANFKTVGWPKCGEIDIMELLGHEPGKVYGTAHWGNPNHASYGLSTALSSGTFADQYHVFSLVWDNKNIKWYLDDVQFVVIDITPAGLSAMHNEFFFIFNVAVGGNWPGKPDGTTVFPQRMHVDYVRVFQPN
jgi:hypothetical protein